MLGYYMVLSLVIMFCFITPRYTLPLNFVLLVMIARHLLERLKTQKVIQARLVTSLHCLTTAFFVLIVICNVIYERRARLRHEHSSYQPIFAELRKMVHQGDVLAARVIPRLLSFVLDTPHRGVASFLLDNFPALIKNHSPEIHSYRFCPRRFAAQIMSWQSYPQPWDEVPR